MRRSALPAFLILATVAVFSQWTFGETQGRLDPHGSREMNLKHLNLSQHTECKVCHTVEKGRLQLKSHPEQLCQSCHGRMPHSGAAEHLGKKTATETITCLSCHYPHRADPVKNWSLQPPDVPLAKWQHPDLPEGWMERPNGRPRLRRVCQDCHS